MEAPVKQPASNAPTDFLSRVDNMLNALTGLGGFNDKGSTARPNVRNRLPLQLGELYSLYLDNGLARKIVDVVPREAVRKGWTVTDDTIDPDLITQENERLGVEEHVCDGMKWARLLGGGIALMVTEEERLPEFRDNPEGQLATPLDLDNVIRLKRLEVFDSQDAVPLEFGRDVEQDGFREPLMWSIGTTGVTAIHHSRVLWFRGAKRPTSLRFFGSNTTSAVDDSVLQHMWEQIRNLTTTMQGGATMAQELREAVMTVAGLASVNTGDQSDKLKERMQLIAIGRGLLGMTVLSEGDKFETRGNPPTGFGELSQEMRVMVSMASEIPMTKLFGETPGGLGGDGGASEEDWNRKVKGEQKLIKPALRQLYTVVYAAKEGPTGGKIPDQWDIEFLPLSEMTEKEEAEVRKIRAETDDIYIMNSSISSENVTKSRFGESGYQTELLPQEPIEEPNMEEALAELERGDGVPVKSVIWAPLSEAGVALSEAARAQASAILGEELQLPDVPHVTILFLGATDSDGLDEIAMKVDLVAAGMPPVEMGHGKVVAFPAGPKGTPIVIEYPHPWPLDQANGALLRALAHRVETAQLPTFRAHTAIGMVSRELTPEELSAISEIDLGDEAWVAAELQLVTDRVIHRAPMSGQ